MPKWYMCVFVHHKAIYDMTSECFMAAFNSFVGRRGCSTQVFSDNGRNFAEAAKAIAQDYLKVLKDKKLTPTFKARIFRGSLYPPGLLTCC